MTLVTLFQPPSKLFSNQKMNLAPVSTESPESPKGLGALRTQFARDSGFDGWGRTPPTSFWSARAAARRSVQSHKNVVANEEMSMTKNQHHSFDAWMRNQRRRHDPVGDLARDAAGDRRWQKAATSLPRLLDYLAGRGACPGAVEACRRAWAEFRAETPTFAHGPRGRQASTPWPSGPCCCPTGERGASGRPANRYFLAGGLGGGHAEQSDGSFLFVGSVNILP